MKAFKTIIILFLVCITYVACDSKDIEKGNKVVFLRDIPLVEGCQNLKLTDTEWKLIGFVDAKQEQLKVAEPESERCYRLRFKEDNTLSGISSTNDITGAYETFSNSSIKITNIGGTEINELYDGKLYVECLKNVKTFSITTKGLALYYDSNNYLLFKPLKL
jgi:META domain.